MSNTAVEKKGLFSGPMNGAQRAFLNLAYNLYLIDHHTDPAIAEVTLQSFVHRLKSAKTGDFIGKLFETYASAAFLKAGFEIEYENESDGSDSHVEFVATYPETGRKFAVEVKARNRILGMDGLALQLHIFPTSESMSFHESEVMDDRCINRGDA